MPIYEYDCPACGRIEVIQKSSEKNLTNCPNCQEKGKKNKVVRAISAAGFQFVGSGWYKTDYASGNTGSTGGSTNTSSTSTSEKSEKSTESKSTETKDTKAGDAKPAKKGPCGSGCGCH
jgi:putative FmdB family regulatory protein